MVPGDSGWFRMIPDDPRWVLNISETWKTNTLANTYNWFRMIPDESGWFRMIHGGCSTCPKRRKQTHWRIQIIQIIQKCFICIICIICIYLYFGAPFHRICFVHNGFGAKHFYLYYLYCLCLFICKGKCITPLPGPCGTVNKYRTRTYWVPSFVRACVRAGMDAWMHAWCEVSMPYSSWRKTRLTKLHV